MSSDDDAREKSTRRDLPNPPTDPPPAPPPARESAPWLVQKYRDHTDGLTRSRIMWTSIAALAIWCVAALVRWCR